MLEGLRIDPLKFDKKQICEYNCNRTFICHVPMKKKQKKPLLHQKIKHHVYKHFHTHAKKILHIANHLHHNIFHGLELLMICFITISSWSFLFANLTGVNEQFYRENSSETATALLTAMQNPKVSLKQWNIISIWSMGLDVENTFAKWYCTYWAARISPEFFPYINETTQQRTRGGNAVDRCKNASDTWYKIWSTPSQWALIIYDAGGRFGSYGHVGKVLHYEKDLKKIIVRDMAWVARGMMSDRREDLTTANVKCYIYNNKTTTPETNETIIPEVTSPEVLPPTKPVVTTPVVTTPVHNAGNTTPTVTTPVVPTTPVVTQPTPPVITIPQSSNNKNISLRLDNLSDIATHFMTQNNLTLTLISKSPLKLGEVATLTIEIKNKTTDEKYSGLLPFAFTILSTNDTIQANISNIKMINNGSIDISLLGQKIWTATIVVSMDGAKIGEFVLDVK